MSFFWFLFIPGKPYMFLFALPFFSFGIGGLFTLMMSMTADACDYEELRKGLPRKEGSFGAIYWWDDKAWYCACRTYIRSDYVLCWFCR